MINWVIFALLAPVIYTGVNFVDKYIVEKEVKDYRGMPIYGTIMGFIMGTIFWILTGFPTLNLFDTSILLLTGAITIWAAALYFKAISMEDTSKIILLFQMTPILVLIMSYIFLDERISIQQLSGFILILGAVVGVSDNIKRGAFQLSKAFWLVLVVDFMWAISAILIKFSINENSFSQVLSYESWGLGLGGLLLYIFFPGIRNSFNYSIKTVRKSALVIMFGNEGLFVFGKSLQFFAYSLGNAALVSIIGSTQVFIGIIVGIVLTIFVPQIIKENITKKVLIKKLILAGVMFIGLVLIGS